MPKRKGKGPTQLNPAKRWLLTWNMNDENQGASTSCSVVPPVAEVDDVELTVESDLSPFSPTSSSHTDGGLVESTVKETVCLAPPNHITKAEYNTLWERASYSITLNEQTPKETSMCQLGQITLILKPHSPSKIRNPFPETLSGSPLRDQTLPKQFPRGRCSLFICTPKPHYLVFDYTMGNAENVPTGYSPSVYMCLLAEIVNEPADVCLDSLQYICHQQTLKTKLKLLHHGYNSKTGHLSLSVCIPHQGISSPAFAAEFVTRADVYSHHIQRIMHWFHGYPLPAPLLHDVTSKRHDFNKLFDAIRLRHAINGDDSINLDVQLQSPCLVPTLREYQRQAVAWMLQKEGYGIQRREEEEREEKVEGKLHCLWSKVRLGEETLYYNVHSGQFTRQRFTQKPSFPGGILADEMGLGKTVEVIACILAHPRYPGSILDSNNDTAENPSSEFETVRSTSSEFSHQEEDNKESSLTPGSGVSNSKQTLEVSAGVASLEVPLGEALEVPPREALFEVPPGKESLEVTPGEALLEVPPGEALPGRESIEAKISEVDSEPLIGSNDTIIDTDQLSCTTGIVDSNSETGKIPSSKSELNTVASTSHSNCHQGVSKANLPQLTESGIKTDQVLENPTSEASSQGKSLEVDHIQYHNNINMDTEPQLPSNSGINDSKTICAAQTSTSCDLEPPGKELHQTVPENTSEVKTEKMVVENSHPSTSCELLIPCKPTKLDSVDSGFEIGLKSKASRHPPQESKELIKAELTGQETVSFISNERKDKMCNGTDGALTTSANQDQTGNVNKCTDSTDLREVSRSGRESLLRTSKQCPSTSETAKEGKGLEKGCELKVKQRKKRSKKLPVSIPRRKSQEESTFKFHCICGVYEEELDRELFYECRQCNGWQHKKCVDYRGVPESDCSLCPMCCVDQPAVSSGATLIVSPKPICHQWIDEINRHVRAHTLKVLVYDGVKKQGFLHPRSLAQHDIVITTYDTLRSELNYVGLLQTNSQKGRRLRYAKRYMAVPSPLPAVEWWRVCLDEAQMVECPTAKTAEMALQLTAVNRWCVTGTPVQRDLSNLYGLILFLGMEPYWVKCWWDNILYKPYLHGNQEPMEEALAKVLWRSAKKDVINQINIPAQTEETHWLNFSPIETHFYKRKHEDCSNNFLQVTGRLTFDVQTKLSTLDRATVQKLMNPLLRLRQACCHPQAVRGEFVSMQRNRLTMAELLQSLTLKAKVESEEAHRQLVCALNGLAAVCVIKGETLDAIQHYRDVLLSAEEHKDRLKTDSLQRLHAMHNLHQLLKLKPEGLIPTLRDGELGKQVQEIRDAYLAKAEAAVQSSLTSLLPLQEKITDLKDQLSSAGPWWVEGLQYIQYLGFDEEFIDKVKNALQSTTRNDTLSVVNHFSTIRGLQMVLVTKMDDLTAAYQRLQSGMMRLNVEVNQELVSEATDCHLRPFGGKPKNRCPFCRVHTLFTEYETCLFSIKQRDNMADPDPEDDDSNVTGPKLLGSWAASETERILRSLLAFLKHHNADEDILQEGNNYVEMVDTQKKEFKSLRVTWTMLSERVAAWDELKMATMRLRLREAHEPDDVTSQPNVIEPNQLDQQRYKLLNDRVLAQSELKKKLGQLVYLRSLSSAQSDLPGGINPEPCPICVRELGKQWSVLPCGHSFCNNCMEMMRVHNSSRRKTIRCAICRSVSSTLEISFVSTDQTNEEEDCSINVRGGYSTKVEAVVRILLQLRNQDLHVKALIFSTWIDVLTVIAKSLKDNDIEYRSIGLFGDRHFKENLMDFKQEECVTALLMPVHSGSKGLNIIEATHVLLVEPILNPASELQAVGRVHRIGQTRPTVVHRFLVRDTIEERLHAFLQAKHTSASLDNLEGETGALTLDTLKQLFTY
ncbi:E3 ubiquitin-protein ligase SHPRH-like [Asterias amurensis]|uniref:E3 ubiquitin-protein ligase SHPRH-like n=1 Tax=Asterias amurensis TaxID=7602 RepID=UPI003AB73472